MALLDRPGGDPGGADAIRSHDDRLLLALLVQVHRAKGHGVPRPELEDIADLDDSLDAQGLAALGTTLPWEGHLQIGELALEIGSGRHRREVVPVAVGPDHVAAAAERLVGQDARHPARANRSHRAGRDAQVSRDLLGARGARLPLGRTGELALVQGMVSSHQCEEGRVVCDEHERLDGEGGIDPEECRHLRDGTDVGGRHLAALPVGSCGCRGHGAGQLDIGRVSASVA